MKENNVKENTVDVTTKAVNKVTAAPAATSTPEAPEAPAANADGAETVKSMATTMGAAMASAIRESAASEKNWTISADTSVDSRFTVVRNKATGEVMLRENSNGHLSKIQLKSIEEKDADIQGAEVTEAY